MVLCQRFQPSPAQTPAEPRAAGTRRCAPRSVCAEPLHTSKTPAINKQRRGCGDKMTIKQTDKAVLTQRCVCVIITCPKDVMKRHLAEGILFQAPSESTFKCRSGGLSVR